MSEGGFWNRAGRRSGGYKPATIILRPPRTDARFQCPDCGNRELPTFVKSGCLGCRQIVELYNAGHLDALWDEWKKEQGGSPS